MSGLSREIGPDRFSAALLRPLMPLGLFRDSPYADLLPAWVVQRWCEALLVEKTLRAMRHTRPDLFVVFKAWLALFSLRDEDTQYTHGVYRGFYAEMAAKLGITEPAVAYRLKRAKLWFVKRLKRVMRREKR